jgi:hypothetical protein
MNMDATPHFNRSHYTDSLQSLHRACDWIGIDLGRASQYKKLIREFHEQDMRSREHILAYNESCEIIDIYERWETPIHNFPGLKQKIKAVFSKGPILREDERPNTSSTSNRPRNDAFVYLLAGKLISLGVNVMIVDGIARQGISCHADTDITFEWNGSAIDIQCKRPQTQKALEKRAKEARRQLKGRTGIIAVDCSAFVRPLGKLLERDSAEDAERFLASLLEKEVKLKVERHLKTAILGFILFARAPAMTRIGHSSILSLHGSPMHTTYRPDSISTWLVISNSSSSNPDVLPSIFDRT